MSDPISPCDCKHRRMKFIQSSQGSPPAYRHYVEVCQDCGEFLVSGWKEGVSFRITFTLGTMESVEAAGKYLKYLEAEDRPS